MAGKGYRVGEGKGQGSGAAEEGEEQRKGRVTRRGEAEGGTRVWADWSKANF